MTLLISITAAVVATLVWYFCKRRSEFKFSLLCFMFWGATIMWLVDAVFEYVNEGASIFAPAAADMLNDAFLGAAVVVLALVIWLAALLIKDPNGVLTDLFKNKSGSADNDNNNDNK